MKELPLNTLVFNTFSFLLTAEFLFVRETVYVDHAPLLRNPMLAFSTLSVGTNLAGHDQ